MRDSWIVSRKECPICKKQIGATAFNRHIKSCKGVKEIVEKDEHGKTKAWYDAMHKIKESGGNNQYIRAKKLGLPIPNVSEKTKRKISRSSSGRKNSEESKKKLSEYRKSFLEKNPDKVPYLMNHSSNGPSYPEKYFIELIKNEKLNFEYHRQVGVYELDFYNEEFKIDLEIDGEQHYSDSKISASDLRRTSFLESLGWKVIRIRWSHWKKMTLSEKKDVVDYIRAISSVGRAAEF